MGVGEICEVFSRRQFLHREKLRRLYEKTYNLYIRDAYQILGSVEEAEDIVQSVFVQIQEDSRLFYNLTDMEDVPAIQYIRRMVYSASHRYKVEKEGRQTSCGRRVPGSYIVVVRKVSFGGEDDSGCVFSVS